MLILLQKVESWDTISILKRFDEFSSVRLYKPTAGHKTRSSFYMIADDVQSRHSKAILAIDKWKAVWQAVTFRSDEDFAKALFNEEDTPEKLWGDFGTKLMEQGREVWAI